MNRVNLKQVWPHQKTSPTNNDALKKEIVNTLGKRMKELRRQSLDNNRRLSNSRDIGHQILSDIICNHRGQSIDNMDIAANPNQMDEQEYINHHQKISSSSSELHDKFSSDTTTFDHNISSALPLSQGSEVSFTNSNSNSNRNCARLSDSFVGSATSGTPYEKLMASYHNASSHETFDESELIEVLGLDTYQEMMCRIEEEIAAEMTQYGEYDINTPIEGIGRNISHVTKSGSQLSLGAINTRNRMDTAMRIDDNDDNDSTYIKVGYQPPLTPTSFNHIESPSDSPSSTCVEGFEEFEEDSIICPNCR